MSDNNNPQASEMVTWDWLIQILSRVQECCEEGEERAEALPDNLLLRGRLAGLKEAEAVVHSVLASYEQTPGMVEFLEERRIAALPIEHRVIFLAVKEDQIISCIREYVQGPKVWWVDTSVPDRKLPTYMDVIERADSVRRREHPNRIGICFVANARYRVDLVRIGGQVVHFPDMHEVKQIENLAHWYHSRGETGLLRYFEHQRSNMMQFAGAIAIDPEDVTPHPDVTIPKRFW